MSTWGKHRLGVEVVQVQFDQQLGVGETIDTIDNISISKLVDEDHTWQDFASEFGDPTGSKANADSAVDIILGEAGAGEQARGEYTILVEVTTTPNSRQLTGTDHTQVPPLYPTVYVSTDGDPSAPAEYP